MDFLTSFNILAQAEAAAPEGGGGGFLSGGIGALLPWLAIFGIFYFIMIRPQQRKEKERQKMILELRAGQRVMFAGGMVGTVVETRENTFLIEIAPGVKIEVARGAVSRVMAEGETATVA